MGYSPRSFTVYFFNHILCVRAVARQIGVGQFSKKNGITIMGAIKGKMVHFLNFYDATAPIGAGPPHSRGFWITHNDATHLVGLLWTSDQLVAKTSS
jgi:hypothetical protein